MGLQTCFADTPKGLSGCLVLSGSYGQGAGSEESVPHLEPQTRAKEVMSRL